MSYYMHNFFCFIQILFFLAVYGQTYDNLKGIIILSKHGEKGVEVSYSTDPYLNEKYWPNGLNQLTNHGKEDSKKFGKVLSEKYSNFSLNLSQNIVGLTDKSYFSIESVHYILSSLFEGPSNFFSSNEYQNMLFGPQKCQRLSKKKNEKLDSSSVKSLYEQNKGLILNITGSSKSNQKLIKNIPVVYESILVELNNYLRQPGWLDEEKISSLKNITTFLDKLYYSDVKIVQLQLQSLLREIRLKLIKNSLNLPNDDVKKGYLYIIGSEQFSALLNVLKIYEERPYFTTSIVLELYSDSYIKVFVYDAKENKLIEKELRICNQTVGCKLVIFLKYLDKFLSDKNLCASKLADFYEDDKNNTSVDKDDLDLQKEQKSLRNKIKIDDFLKTNFEEMIKNNKELFVWLSDLFSRDNNLKKQNFDGEDDLKLKLKQILRQRISQIDNIEERIKLESLLKSWTNENKNEEFIFDLDNQDTKNFEFKQKLKQVFEKEIRNILIEKYEENMKFEQALYNLTSDIKMFKRSNLIEEEEKNFLNEKIKTTIDQGLEDYNYLIDRLSINIQRLVNEKLEEIKDNWDEKRIRDVSNYLNTESSDFLENLKMQNRKKLDDLKKKMIEHISSNTENLNKKTENLKLIQDQIKNHFLNFEKTNKTFFENSNNDFNSIIKTFKSDYLIEKNNTSQNKDLKQMKDNIKKIENNLAVYLNKNKVDKQKLDEDLKSLKNFSRHHSKISIGLLTRVMKTVKDERLKANIKNTIRMIIDFIKTNKNLEQFIVETDLNTLVDEIEEVNRNVSSSNLDLKYLEQALNITFKPNLLKLNNPYEESSSSRIFWIIISISTSLAVIAYFLINFGKRYKKRREYIGV